MTNAEKYKTAEERSKAYLKFCREQKHCNSCKLRVCNMDGGSRFCVFKWLDLEYKEELKECPFCGGEPVLYKGDCSFVKCHNCDAESFHGESSEEVIAAWNRRV